MSQAENPHITNLSRRSVLAGISIAAAPAAAAVDKSLADGADADPIFALIEQHRAAEDAFGALLIEQSKLEVELPDDLQQSKITVHGAEIVETDDPRWIAAAQASWGASEEGDRAALALLDTEPTTAAGLAALLRYVYQYEADGGQWPDNVLNDDDADDEYGVSFSSVLLQHAADVIESLLAAEGI
jgi:hypothetical protein